MADQKIQSKEEDIADDVFLMSKTISEGKHWKFDDPETEAITLQLSINDQESEEIFLKKDKLEFINRKINTEYSCFSIDVLDGEVAVYYTFNSKTLEPIRKKIKGNQGQEIIRQSSIETPPLTRPFSSIQSTFHLRIDSDAVTIDKTALIRQMLKEFPSVIVIGPRRFGKTVIATTIRDLYSQGSIWWNEGCSDFAVASQDQKFPRHPVLTLNFGSLSKESDMLAYIKKEVSKMITSHQISLEAVEEEELKESKEKFEDDKNTTNLLAFMYEAVYSVVRKRKRGIILIIDEYDHPMVNAIPETLDLNVNVREVKEVEKLLKFYELFFSKLKAMRTQSTDEILKFTYVAGVLPIKDFGIFSGSNDMKRLRDSRRYDALLGFTREELEHNKDYKEMLLKMISKQKRQEAAAEKKEFELVLEDLKLHYNGFKFHPGQKETLYSPFGINSLLESAEEGDYNFKSYFAECGSTKLIWRSVRRMTIQQKFAFLWAVLDPENKVIIQHFKGGARFDEGVEIDKLMDNFEHIAFYSGYLTIAQDETGRSCLKITNKEMQISLQNMLMKNLNFDDQSTILKILSNGEIEGQGEGSEIKQFFQCISDQMQKLSIFIKGKKDSLEHEDYAHTLFAYIVRLLFAYNDLYEKEDLQDAFFCSNEEPLFESKLRPDCIMTFTNKKNKKKNLIVEFKCKEDPDCALKEAKKDLLKKYKQLVEDAKKEGYAKKLDGGQYVFLAAALMSGQIENLHYYNSVAELEEDAKNIIS